MPTTTCPHLEVVMIRFLTAFFACVSLAAFSLGAAPEDEAKKAGPPNPSRLEAFTPLFWKLGAVGEFPPNSHYFTCTILQIMDKNTMLVSCRHRSIHLKELATMGVQIENY